MSDKDQRRYSPSAARNKAAIAPVFLREMSGKKHILEIASGTGEHGVFMLQTEPGLSWTFSDIEEDNFASQKAWQAAYPLLDLRGPEYIDAALPVWPVETSPKPLFDAIFCANMIHIAPFSVCEGLLKGAGRLLPKTGRIFLYGPFARAGEITPSNQAFSEDLRRRNRDWGVRDLEKEIVPRAHKSGLTLVSITDMPANNLSIVFEKTT